MFLTPNGNNNELEGLIRGTIKLLLYFNITYGLT